MLTEAVTISSSSSTGNGEYNISLIFSQGAKASYLRVGDTVRDRDGFAYSVTSWASFPDDYSSGAGLTVSFIDQDQLPATFGGFGNAQVFTPGQVDNRPAVLSAGSISTQSLESGQQYRYNVSCSWFDPSANNVQLGAHVTDSAGKSYEVVVTNANGTTMVVEEVLKEGENPALGPASLHNPTPTYKLYRGTPVSDPARTVIRNKDNFAIDAILSTFNGSSTASSSTKSMVNQTGSEISALTPIAKLADGSIGLAESDNAANSQFIGISTEAIPNGQAGAILIAWPNVENILTGQGFVPGEEVFMGETPGTFLRGTDFTNSDDRFVKLGIADCAAGIASPTATDLIMFVEVLGGP